MAIYKSKTVSEFTIIPNEVFKSGMSLEAIGLLAYFLSLPKDWVIYKTVLHNQLGVGREKLDRMFKELQAVGYVISVEKRESGKISYEHIVYDKPFNGEPLTEKPYTGFPSTADTPLQRTKEQRTKKQRKENKEREIPTYSIFEQYALEKKPNVNLLELKRKYDAWVLNEWRDGNGAEISNWKIKLNNTLPYIKENFTKPQDPVRVKTRDDFWNEEQYKAYCLKNNIEYKEEQNG